MIKNFEFQQLFQQLKNIAKTSSSNVYLGLLKEFISKNIKDEEGASLLHYCAMDNCIPSIVLFEELVKLGMNINEPNNHGSTPLHIAVTNINTYFVTRFLKEGADPNIKNDLGITALHIAVLLNNLELVNVLSEKTDLSIKDPTGLSVYDYAIRLDDQAIAVTLKNIEKQRKANIISLGPLSLTDGSIPATVEAIESQLYFENPYQKASFKGRLGHIYDNAKILRPLMDIMAMSALGYHKEQFVKEKHFKIVVTKEPDISNLKPYQTGKIVGTYMVGKNTAFASSVSRLSNVIMSCVLHESAHFVFYTVFQNDCKPFFANDHEAEKEWNKIITRIQNDYKSISIHDYFSNGDKSAQSSLASIFENYQPKDYACELAVKVPEIIGLMNVKGGVEWLMENTPDLLQFYTTYINKHLNEYLLQHNAQAKIVSKTFDDDKDNPSDLEKAVTKNDILTVKVLLSADTCSEDILRSAIIIAMQNDQQDMLNILIETPDIHRNLYLQAVTLCSAAKFGRPKIIERLFQKWKSNIKASDIEVIFTESATHLNANIFALLLRHANVSSACLGKCLNLAIDADNNDVAQLIIVNFVNQLPIDLLLDAMTKAIFHANTRLISAITLEITNRLASQNTTVTPLQTQSLFTQSEKGRHKSNDNSEENRIGISRRY